MIKPTTNNITADLKRDEGLRLKPYLDSVGKMTIGYGRLTSRFRAVFMHGRKAKCP